MTDASKILAAAEAAFPELWPSTDEELTGPQKAARAFNRQYAVERVAKALKAYSDAVRAETPTEPTLLEEQAIRLPDDAAMIQQTLTVIQYIDTEGQSAIKVHTTGDGQITSWLGLVEIAKLYVLQTVGIEFS